MGKNKLIKFSEKDWHFKLIKFVWGVDPSMMFKNLCPYFWLMIASIFCLPFVIFWKILAKIGKFFFEVNERIYLDHLSKLDLFFFWAEWYGTSEDRDVIRQNRYIINDRFKKSEETLRSLGLSESEFFKKFGLDNKKIKDLKFDFEREINVIAEKINIQKRKKQLDRERKERSEKRTEKALYAISSFFKRLFQGILILLIIGLGYLVSFVFTEFLCWIIDSAFGKDFIGILGWCLLGVVIATAIYISIRSYEESWKDNLKSMTWLQLVLLSPLFIIYVPLKFIFRTIIWNVFYYVVIRFLWNIIIVGIVTGFRDGIVEFGGIFGDYLDASYSEYCPTINWEKKK